MSSSERGSMARQSDAEEVQAYHNESKHHFHRYAPGPRGLDWANQPDPYRRFEGAQEVALPHAVPEAALKKPYSSLYGPPTQKTSSEAMGKQSVSSFLFHSMALSAKKVVGRSSWCLRVNPSSGNLHPTEAYIAADSSLLGSSSDEPLASGLFHYRPDRHWSRDVSSNSPTSGTK